MKLSNRHNSLTGRERTLDFLAGKPTDRPPFHPIIMRWAARHAGVKYRDFCLDPASKCRAMIRCAEDFDIDWVTVMSDPYAEASAFGIQVEYPENDLPRDTGHFDSVEALLALQPYDVAAHRRTAGRVEEIRLFREMSGPQYFVVGWVEGPVAEYANLRGLSEASLDFMDEPSSRHPPESRFSMSGWLLMRFAHGLSFNDALIAATASVHHLTLATRNVSDFAHTGIPIVNLWTASLHPPTPP